MNPPFLCERDHSSVTIAWSKVAIADSYELEMQPDGEEWVSLSNSLKGTSIRKKNLVDGVVYVFRVRYKASGDSTWSEFSGPPDGARVLESEVRIMDPPELAARDDISVTLQWKEVDGAAGYMIRYRSDETDASPSPDTLWQKVASVIKATTVRKKGLKQGVSYYFAVLPIFLDTEEPQTVWSYSLSSAPGKVVTMNAFMQKLFPAQLIAASGKLVPASSVLAGKCVAIYFSAHWCGPCRQFTPKLLELYGQCKAANKRFEIVFCSADNSEQEFRQYHASMSWPAIGYDEEHREGMMGMFKVSGIPRLVVLAASGRAVVDNAISGAPLTPAVVDQWIQMSDSMK
jgi:thiol-disulfide isomerase/thioredoxin